MKTWTAIVECGGKDIEEIDVQAPTKREARIIAERQAADLYGDAVILEVNERLP